VLLAQGGQWCCGLRNGTGSMAYGLGDGACEVDGITGLGLGKMAACMEGSTRARNDNTEALGRT
jgi:hypothetical protein